MLKDLLTDFCKQLSVHILEPLLALSTNTNTDAEGEGETVSVVEAEGTLMELNLNLHLRGGASAAPAPAAVAAEGGPAAVLPRLEALIGLLADLTRVLDFVHRQCLDSQRRFTAALGNLLLSATATDGAASSGVGPAASSDGLGGGGGGGPLRRALFGAIEGVLPDEAASLSKPHFEALQAAVSSGA